MNKTETKTGTEISELPTNATIKDVIQAYNALIRIVPAKRDRGPGSKREMTQADADRVTSGDLKDAKTKVAAEKLGLSYGQVYSARNGHTFKKKS